MTTKFASLLLGLGVSIIGFSQTSLTKVSFINEEVTNVSAFSGNYNFSYSTLDAHNVYNSISSTITSISTNPAGYNDIDGSKSAIGDTLSVISGYKGTVYGKIIKNNSEIADVGLEVRSLTENDDYIFTLGKYGSVYKVVRIDKNTESLATWSICNNIAQQDSIGSSYKEIQFFEYQGIEYLLIYGFTYNSNDSYTLFQLYSGSTNTNAPINNELINSSFYSYNNGLYVSQGNQIRALNYLSGGLVLQTQYTTSNTINDISFNDQNIDSTGFEFRIFAATNDGVYSNDVTLNVEDKELDNSQITMYPNPNNGTFTIKNVSSDALIQIVDINGKEVSHTMFSGSINTDLPNGVYFVKITQHNTIQTLKFIKR